MRLPQPLDADAQNTLGCETPSFKPSVQLMRSRATTTAAGPEIRSRGRSVLNVFALTFDFAPTFDTYFCRGKLGIMNLSILYEA